jgi:hypothetical protein
MASTSKRRRKTKKKSALLKRLKVLESMEVLSEEDEKEIEEILRLLNKKRTNKIETKKLNNNKLNETISINININNSEPSRDIDWSTPDHYSSAAGTYRKARIDNRKY